ncbi:anthranilate phosphoribosyltransferase [Parenemella sanctibonifatiensis]|uniref:Anthranilate phosphoribosyltransferase n=1 Tax=Parenemella sanctibonifatiensis TaxID=2016505 RepID=A0A255EEY0_9ACTN|nr:anthranilate phosphoribosyltransferase [Parenemella sanctibonifatiensis]OYN89790.1 anthranilate phosphoribosyltransferase [Parenemella sanctibonifatiensis]
MTAPTWPDILTSLVDGEDLSPETARWAMGEILTGNANPVHLAGFAVALRAKGETVDELTGLADAMLERATPIELDTEAVDIVGSGGDRANTVNISTMASVVAAAAGAKVVKHGNRAASSASGSADCLEAAGVALNLPPQAQAEVLDQAGIAFLFAPHYHPSLRHAGPTRSQLGIRTVFNFLGPIANPARPVAQAIGVADERVAALVAGVLSRRGNRGMVFHGKDGLDELTTTTTSQVWLFRDGRIVETVLDPADLGVRPAAPADLVGGDPAHNAGVMREVFAGAQGPVRDIVVINAAAALLAFHGPDLDEPIADQFRVQFEAAARAIDEGAASEVLERWVALTSERAS